MSKTLKYLLITLIFVSLATASYTFGQDKAVATQTLQFTTYDYQTTSFDPVGNQNEYQLFLKTDIDLQNTTIKPHYLPATSQPILRQNKRELCAFNLRTSNRQWVDFINQINQKCTYENIDNCWQQSAIQANYNPEDIIECFSNT